MATLSSGRCFSGVNNAKLSADTKQHNMHHIEVLAEEIAVKVSKVLRTNEADVQACMECADGMLEASMSGNSCGAHEKAMSMHFALQDLLHQNSVRDGLQDLQQISQRLRGKLLDMQLAEHGLRPSADGEVVAKEQPDPLGRNRRRLAFELERKVELLAKKVQSKSHECEDLRRANEKLRSELYRSTKQVHLDDFVDMDEAYKALQGLKRSIAAAVGSAPFTAIEQLHEIMEKVLWTATQRVTEAEQISSRRAMLLEESERELAESKANVTRLQAELQASIRLQEETEKVSKLPRFSRNQERVELQEQISELEEAVSQWQLATEEAHASLSDQVSENEALRKQLLAADDKRQQLLAQFDAGVKIEVARLTAEAEGSRAEVVKLRNELVRSEAAKAEMSAALLELKDDLGEQEFSKLEEEVDTEMEMGELTPPDWIVQKVAAGEMLDVDAGRLARKLTAMIKRSAAAEQEVSDDTENIISEFVDKAELQNVRQELHKQQQVARELREKADDAVAATNSQAHAALAANRFSTGSSTFSTALGILNLSSEPSIDTLRLEMEIAHLQTKIAGVESESASKGRRILQLEEELGHMLTELENSEVRQAELEAQIDFMKERRPYQRGSPSSATRREQTIGRSYFSLQQFHPGREEVDPSTPPRHGESKRGAPPRPNAARPPDQITATGDMLSHRQALQTSSEAVSTGLNQYIWSSDQMYG